ncbi:MAG: HesB/IscA family protein [Gammaproteobacteria bacterium]
MQATETAPVRVTQEAATHIQRQLAVRGKGLGIRLGVRESGCSGMAYVLEFVDETVEQDIVLDQFGVRFFMAPDSLIYLNGAELDLVREGVNEGLRFSNPNATSECGCGESFNL